MYIHLIKSMVILCGILLCVLGTTLLTEREVMGSIASIALGSILLLLSILIREED